MRFGDLNLPPVGIRFPGLGQPYLLFPTSVATTSDHAYLPQDGFHDSELLTPPNRSTSDARALAAAFLIHQRTAALTRNWGHRAVVLSLTLTILVDVLAERVSNFPTDGPETLDRALELADRLSERDNPARPYLSEALASPLHLPEVPTETDVADRLVLALLVVQMVLTLDKRARH